MDDAAVCLLIAGSTFGFALTFSGIWVPAIITGQFRGESSTLLGLFLAVSTCNILILPVFSYLNVKKPGPRSPSPLPFLPSLGPYGGNIVGGATQGLAMALVGASPETLLIQLLDGAGRSIWILVGCLLGGIFYVGVRGWGGDRAEASVPVVLKDRNVGKAVQEADELQHKKDSGVISSTVESRSSFTTSVTSETNTTLVSRDPLGKAIYLTLLISLTYIYSGSGPQRNDSLSAKLLGFSSNLVRASPIALSQLATVVLTGNPLGVSGMYENVGLKFWHQLSTVSGGRIDPLKRAGKSSPAMKSAIFAGGVLMGGWIAYASGFHIIRSNTGYFQPRSETSVVRALVGGFMMAVGSRISGGCTSGHGISGLSAMSMSSFVTVGSMSIAGLATGLLLRE